MSRQVKISTRLSVVNNRAKNAREMTCFKNCPKLDVKTDAGVTFRSISICPIMAKQIYPDTVPCAYGRRLIASDRTKKSNARRVKQ